VRRGPYEKCRKMKKTTEMEDEENDKGTKL